MDMNENRHNTPTAPPPLPESAYPAALTPAQPPRWPTVIGIVSICLAGIGFLSVLISQKGISDLAAREVLTVFPGWYTEYNQAAIFIGLGVSVVLLLAGIQTLRRKPGGRMLHMLYAVLAIIQIVIGLVVFMLLIRQIDTTSQPQPKISYFDISLASGYMRSMAEVSYLIFLLIWFSLRKIREQVRQWN